MLRVLVVDDARLIADLATTALARSNVRVTVAQAADLVDLASDDASDVVILADGEGCPEPLSSCRRLRKNERTRAARIIYVGSNLSRQRCLATGFDLYIPRLSSSYEQGEALAAGTALPARRALRRAVDVSCSLAFSKSEQDGHCLDLSVGGCRMAVAAAPPVGAAGRLRLGNGGGDEGLPVEVLRIAEQAGATTELAVRFVLDDPDAGIRVSRSVRQRAERRGQLPRQRLGAIRP